MSFFGYTRKKRKEKHNNFLLDIAIKIKNYENVALLDLSKEFNLPLNKVRDHVFECIERGLIYGYILKGDSVYLKKSLQFNNNKQVVYKLYLCDGCGASFTSDSKIAKCPYCNRLQ